MFQDPTASLNPTMPLGKQLREVAGTAERAEELLDAVGVPEAKARLRSYPHELSGGQRQRVMIAMAIAGDPALVVADEPTTALDVTIQAQILQLIRRLRDELGCAFLVVTHDLGVAAQIADRIAVCYAGLVVETGPAADVLRHPTHPYTAGLMRSRITLDSERLRILATLPGEPPDMRDPPPGCPFAPRCKFEIEACTKAVPPLEPVAGRPQRSACIRAEELGERIFEQDETKAAVAQRRRARERRRLRAARARPPQVLQAARCPEDEAAGAARARPRRAPEGVRRPGRRERLRQVDAAAGDRGPHRGRQRDASSSAHRGDRRWSSRKPAGR